MYNSTSTHIYTKPTCPYCIMLKKQLKHDGVTYTDHDVSNIPNFSFKTVPQMYYHGKYIGGYTDYMQFRKNIKSRN